MNFARKIPERAYDVRDIRGEQAREERHQLLATIAVLCEAMDPANYSSKLEWQLAMTIVRGSARKLLRQFNYSEPQS